MARARTGTIEKRGASYWARHTVTTEGVTVRRWFSLDTSSLAVARAKNKLLCERIARGEVPSVDAATVTPETCAEAIRRIVAEMRNYGLKSWKDRLHRLETYAVPVLGTLEVGAVNAGNIQDALEECRAAGKSKQTIIHLRNDLHAVFDALWRTDTVKENPVAKARIPKLVKDDDRPRQVLTDEEFVQFMGCADVSLLLRTMALVSRVFGGMRTGDLHAWRWEHIDTVGWTTAKIRRQKVRGLTLIEMPQTLLPWLKHWWTTNGCKRVGPVFPVGRGDRAEEHRGHTGYARQLRAALLAAGVTRPELHYDGAESRRVDFHSFRRAYVTALTDSGVNAQQSMALAAHTKLETHLRYNMLGKTRALKTPDGIAPEKLGQLPVAFRSSTGERSRIKGLLEVTQ